MGLLQVSRRRQELEFQIAAKRLERQQLLAQFTKKNGGLQTDAVSSSRSPYE